MRVHNNNVFYLQPLKNISEILFLRALLIFWLPKKLLMSILIAGNTHIVHVCCCASPTQTYTTLLSSQGNDSMSLWPLDRACHHYALVTLYKYSLPASLTAFHLPYQYYISMYLIHPLWIASHSIQTMPWIDFIPNSYFHSLMQCRQQALIKPSRF